MILPIGGKLLPELLPLFVDGLRFVGELLQFGEQVSFQLGSRLAALSSIFEYLAYDLDGFLSQLFLLLVDLVFVSRGLLQLDRRRLHERLDAPKFRFCTSGHVPLLALNNSAAAQRNGEVGVLENGQRHAWPTPEWRASMQAGELHNDPPLGRRSAL
jgi:hypothetical protein